mgnify:CR=1 FL=1
MPWLASEFSHGEPTERGSGFALRPGVRFHDGRRLTARDVRHSYERLRQSTESDARWFLLADPRREAGLERRSHATSEGFRIVSPSEFVIELEKPVSFFPALISYGAMAIVPEGTTEVGGSWREKRIGTGPFRAVAFEPGRRLELERNPHYWREGVSQERGHGLPLRRFARRRSETSSWPAGFSLAVGPAAGRCGSLAPRRPVRFRLPRDPAPADLLHRLQPAPGPDGGRRTAPDSGPRPGRRGACAAISGGSPFPRTA